MPEPTAGELLKEARRVRGEAEPEEGLGPEAKRRFHSKSKKLEIWNGSKWELAEDQMFIAGEETGGLVLIVWPEGVTWIVPTSKDRGDKPENYPIWQTWGKPPAGKGYATKEAAAAQALPGETQVQLPDGSWDNVKALAEKRVTGYASRGEAAAQALPGEVQIKLPDGSWDNVKAPARPAVRGYASREAAQAQAQPGEIQIQLPDGSWDNVPVQPSGVFATQAEAVAHAARIGRSDLVPRYDPKTGGFTLAEKPKVTAKDLLDQAIVDNDLEAAFRLNDLMNLPTAQERFSMALQYARSPADYQTVIGMMRGELPMQAGGGAFPRAFDITQQALFGVQGARVQAPAQLQAPVTAYGPGGAPQLLPPGSPMPPGYTATPPQVGQGAAALTPGQAPTTAGTIRYIDRDTGGVLDLPPGVDPETYPGNWEYQRPTETGGLLGPSPGPGPDQGLTTSIPPGITGGQRILPRAATMAEEGEWMTNPQGETVGVPREAVERALGQGWKTASTPMVTDVPALSEPQRAAWRRKYGYEPEQYLRQAGPEAFRYRLSQLQPEVSLVPPEARTGAVAKQRALLPETNPDIFRFPSMQTWNRWTIPEQQAFRGGLEEMGISDDWLKEYERQWRASTQPAGQRRARITSARSFIPGGAIR